MNIRSTNKAPLRPIIKAKAVQVQHQIDLMDLKAMQCQYEGQRFGYILSVMDDFSRYLWLRPLCSKNSETTAQQLVDIYHEHGPPRIVQSDNGKEFKGSVKTMLRMLKVKTVNSRPYRPQSQGKVERCQRVLRKKILYDLLTMKKRGVNWVENLHHYNKVMNDEKK